MKKFTIPLLIVTSLISSEKENKVFDYFLDDFSIIKQECPKIFSYDTTKKKTVTEQQDYDSCKKIVHYLNDAMNGKKHVPLNKELHIPVAQLLVNHPTNEYKADREHGYIEGVANLFSSTYSWMRWFKYPSVSEIKHRALLFSANHPVTKDLAKRFSKEAFRKYLLDTKRELQESEKAILSDYFIPRSIVKKQCRRAFSQDAHQKKTETEQKDYDSCKQIVQLLNATMKGKEYSTLDNALHIPVANILRNHPTNDEIADKEHGYIEGIAQLSQSYSDVAEIKHRAEDLSTHSVYKDLGKHFENKARLESLLEMKKIIEAKIAERKLQEKNSEKK
jgi:uncharacterized protein (DUF2267 family)